MSPPKQSQTPNTLQKLVPARQETGGTVAGCSVFHEEGEGEVGSGKEAGGLELGDPGEEEPNT